MRLVDDFGYDSRFGFTGSTIVAEKDVSHADLVGTLYPMVGWNYLVRRNASVRGHNRPVVELRTGRVELALPVVRTLIMSVACAAPVVALKLIDRLDPLVLVEHAGQTCQIFLVGQRHSSASADA